MSQNPYRSNLAQSARQQRSLTTLNERPPPPPYSALQSVAPRSVVLTPPLPIDFLLLPLVGESVFAPQPPQSSGLASTQLQAFVPPSSSAASCVDDKAKCTICFDFRAVWHCDSDGTAVCEECLDRLVNDMPPGPLCCPDCRRGQIPAQTVLEAVSPDMAARYRSRRAAGLRGDGNQWLQTAAMALKAGTTLPPQLWTADVPAVPAGLSPEAEAAAQHEAQYVADLAREAQDDVRRAWERIRCITDPAALQSELDQLADESLAIACPTAKMCPRCEYGPVLNTGCDDLAQHHGERQMSNCCRGCGFFGVSTDKWRPWDFVNRLHLPNGPSTETDISRLASKANVTEPEALQAICDADGDLDRASASLTVPKSVSSVMLQPRELTGDAALSRTLGELTTGAVRQSVLVASLDDIAKHGDAFHRFLRAIRHSASQA